MIEPKPLTPDDIRAAHLPAGKKFLRLGDGRGLYLLIERRTDGESKSWRLRYKRAGKDTMMSLGTYPAVNLESARRAAHEARLSIMRGEDPQAARRAEKAQQWLQGAKTFGIVGAEYNRTQEHRSPKTVERCERMLRHASKLHNKTFAQLDRPTLLQACRVLEAQDKRETAHRLGIYFSQVFRYARDEGYYKGEDPTQGGFGKSLKPIEEENQPALIDPRQVGALMRVIDSDWIEMCTPTVYHALQLLARTAVRPGELRLAEWIEFDLTGAKHDGHATWRIPLNRMKMRDGNRTDHIVPLSRQAVAILKAQQEAAGGSRYVFPGHRTDARPLSDAALSAALIALGYRGQIVPHGMRTMFASLCRDMLKAESELVERQLAHKVGSDVAGAYDRSQRLDERRKLMDDYSALLERLRDGI